ncbi:MAG TPA: GNAT family N-acetyltransferase [Firmicutes bacterium]|nr:GNAT family N-acetyltransferase [Bacillota bacterium]
MDLILETPRLILREFVLDDWRAVHEYASDPEVTRYLSWGPNDEAASQHFVAAVITKRREQPRSVYDLAVTLRETGKLIGGCGIYRQRFGEGELGYCLHRSYWNRGYMTEAVRAFLEWAFTEGGFHRIYARCHPANTASARVMEKNGMKKEGCLRDHMYKDGRWSDALLYAILEDEWREFSGKNRNE